MGAVGPQPGLNSGGRFAIAVGYEVIRVSSRHCVVGFEVAVRDYMMVVPLEQCDLQQKGISGMAAQLLCGCFRFCKSSRDSPGHKERQTFATAETCIHTFGAL